MSIETNINTRIVWLRDALDSIVKLSPQNSTIISHAEQISNWLLRMLETQDTADKYSLWCEKRMEFSHFSESLYRMQPDNTGDGSGDCDDESQNLAITYTNIIQFQDELQGLFAEMMGERNNVITMTSSAPSRRTYGRNPAKSPNIPAFLHVTH